MLDKSVTLTFPVNTTQLIGYTTSTYTYYNIYFPTITSDSQLGTEIIFIRSNSASLNSSASSSGVCGVVSRLSYIGSGNSYRYTLFKNFYLFRIPF